ncbi:hypothetical protein NM208_g1502 [Fusarium decemcellulare]|uniref:Uncharacterized protein n=1 Tax=Fusarium decemcellulare TaxID=57161 RepID=A0ACC1SVX0_9HYPO|nr:hypothetical protein NM208_g1502 [Fusarium decemcellulare]
MPSFVAYAAYCGIAIQIPFLWCSDSTVRDRAQAHIGANVKMIQMMSSYWKLASLLIKNEPKHTDISEFINFKVDTSLARSSILEFTGILRSHEGGYIKPGEESDVLTPKRSGHDQGGNGVGATHRLFSDSGLTESCNVPDPSETGFDVGAPISNHGASSQETAPLEPRHRDGVQAIGPLASDWPTVDVFNSLFDADLAGFLPEDPRLDLSVLESDLLNWDFLTDDA